MIWPLRFLLILLVLPTQVLAQTETFLHFKSLTIDDGLSQGAVNAIMQDASGIMWFTTSDGLNKYDGYNFTVYHHDIYDSTSLSSDDLTYVFEDSEQRLWVATRNNGLDFFDRKYQRFYHITHSNSKGLLSNKVASVCSDKTGALLITTDLGIDRMQIISKKKAGKETNNFFDNYELKFTHLKFGNNIPEMTGKNVKGNIFTDSRGHTFITSGANLYEIIINADNTYIVTKKYNIPSVKENEVTTLLEDSANYSLFLNGVDLIRFPGYDFKLGYTFYENKDRISLHTWTIGRNHVIWNSDSENLQRINISTGEVRYFIPDNPKHRAALKTIISIYSDRQNILWIGTAGNGILKYDPEKERFHHILPNTVQYQLLQNNADDIVTRDFQKILFDKYSLGYKIDSSMHNLKKNLANNFIIQFTKDTSGNLWIPFQNRLLQYNAKTQEEKTYEILLDDVSGQIYTAHVDKNNNLWMGFKKYLLKFTIATKTFSKYTYPLHLENYETDFLQTIYEDGNLLWLGTTHGIFRFDIAADKITSAYYAKPADSSSLSANVVYSFCNDIKQPKRYLWIGLKGGGLNRMDKYTGRFTRYSRKDGLADNVIYGILPGDDGNLWLSSNQGLSAFNAHTQTFRNFDVNDGLQSNEFNRYAYCKTSTGILFFGGMNGINYFDPKQINPLKSADVVFTDLRLFNKSVKLTDEDCPIKQSIEYADEIKLAYTQNVIAIQFAAVDYRRQGNILYRYKMIGFDKDWIYSGNAHEATYTNLDPGEYTFVVQASFESENWGEKETSIDVTVLEPWYHSWWFYLIVLVTIAGISYALYRFRLAQFRMLEKLRNRIAMDLHDEVGSSISTIAIYSKIMQDQIGSVDFDNKPLVHKINVFAEEIMESMNDIVWSINTKNDAFETIGSRIRMHATQLLEPKGYTIHFEFSEALNRLKIGMEKRRELYLIYKEVLNNIAKYANGENVWISLAIVNNLVQLTIKDDGAGFDVKDIPNKGNGLMNIKNRAALIKGKLSINSQPGNGTEIILSFSSAEK